MPVYFAKSIAAGAARSQAFASKSIPNYTMATLSEVPQLAKAVSTELAFSGYKDAIEAFIYATAIKSKVSTQAGFYPLPDFNPSIPLPIPPIVFRSRTTLNNTQVAALLAHFESSGIKTLPVGNGPQGFVVERPTWTNLNSISRLAGQNTTNPGSVIQQSAITPIRTLYKCIELFLRTNTYYYRRDDALTRYIYLLVYGPYLKLFRINADLENLSNIDAQVMIGLPRSVWYITDKKRVGEPLTKEIFEEIRGKTLGEETAFRNRVTHVPGLDAVLIAKPSPKPFEASLGSTTTVPYEPGLLFPYFNGMITCDTRGLRDIVGRLFFRNFGTSVDSDARRGFQEFRENAGIIASSSMGPIIGHILKSFELALEAQAHAYLIFDNSDYLGCVILGDHYWVHNGQQWVEPMTAEHLKDELRELQTHETTLGGIAVLLSEMRDIGGDTLHVDAGDISTSKGLLDILAEVDEDQGDKVKALGKLIQGLKFKGGFKEISPQNVSWALSHLTTERDSPLDEVNLYIPLSGWAECASREYQVFAAFGPRAFHLQNKRGLRFGVPRRMEDADPLGAMEGNPPVRVHPRILIYPCPIVEAVKKWKTFLEDGILCMDFDERARGSRAISWEGRNRDIVWEKVKEIGRGDFIHERVRPVASSIGKKRALPVDFDEGEFEEILGL
jgi:hypothetical protein